MFHCEWNGLDISRFVLQGTVEIENRIGERPVASLRLRKPDGVPFGDAPKLLVDGQRLLTDGTRLLITETDVAAAPQDFDEFTIDYPHRPYRAEALLQSPAGVLAA